MALAEQAVNIPDGETATVLFVKSDGVTDIDVTHLSVNGGDGITAYLLQDGALAATLVEAFSDALEPALACDNTFEVRVKNASGSPFDAFVRAQYLVRHTNRAPLPSGIKVKPNLKLRRRFLRS